MFRHVIIAVFLFILSVFFAEALVRLASANIIHNTHHRKRFVGNTTFGYRGLRQMKLRSNHRLAIIYFSSEAVLLMAVGIPVFCRPISLLHGRLQWPGTELSLSRTLSGVILFLFLTR